LLSAYLLPKPPSCKETSAVSDSADYCDLVELITVIANETKADEVMAFRMIANSCHEKHLLCEKEEFEVGWSPFKPAGSIL
jgi:hypothetical protein